MSGLKRFFVSGVGDNSTVNVTGEEFFHAVSVMRLKKGDRIILCDGTPFDYSAEITEVGKKDFTAKIVGKTANPCEAKTDVALITGFLKGDKSETVVQKATELGVKKIILFSSKYSSAYFSENKLERLKKVAAESSKQCGRSVVCDISYADTLVAALNMAKDYKNKLFACEFARNNQADFSALDGSTAIVVGSEGGFSEEEFSEAKALGCTVVSLGKRILRAETAAITLTGIVMHRLGELE